MRTKQDTDSWGCRSAVVASATPAQPRGHDDSDSPGPTPPEPLGQEPSLYLPHSVSCFPLLTAAIICPAAPVLHLADRRA